MKHTEWKTAISTSETGLDCLIELINCGINAIELSVSEWEYRNIDWDSLGKNAREAGIELWSYHLPFGDSVDISAEDSERRETALAIYFSLINKACSIGIKRFVVHPSYEPIADSEREGRLENAKESLARLAEYADALGAVICIEDLPRSCLGHNIAELKALASADERLRICFDVNHLLLQFKDTHADFVRELCEKIATVHFSDYDFIDERHWLPGEGKVDWTVLYTAFEECNYNGVWMYGVIGVTMMAGALVVILLASKKNKKESVQQ